MGYRRSESSCEGDVRIEQATTGSVATDKTMSRRRNNVTSHRTDISIQRRQKVLVNQVFGRNAVRINKQYPFGLSLSGSHVACIVRGPLFASADDSDFRWEHRQGQGARRIVDDRDRIEGR